MCIMQLIIMTSSELISIIFSQMNHTLAMGLMLLIQTLNNLSLNSIIHYKILIFLYFIFSFSSSYSCIIFYVTSLASNEMFSLFMNTILYTVIAISLIIPILLFSDLMSWLTLINNNDMLNPSNITLYQEESYLSLMKLCNQPTGTIT